MQVNFRFLFTDGVKGCPWATLGAVMLTPKEREVQLARLVRIRLYPLMGITALKRLAL